MESLDKFFKDNQRGYPRDPRRMAYAKLQKNTQGMDREQLEAFITANLFIPHSQYKMALGNLIQFLKKQDQMSKLNEVKQFQKIAGLLKERIESAPETITQAFQQAGIDLNKPVVYICDYGNPGGTDEPVKTSGGKLLQKLEAERAEEEGEDPDFNESEGITYEINPTQGQGELLGDYDRFAKAVKGLECKLNVYFSDSHLYEIWQAEEVKETWHPDDPASVDMDDMEDEDPEDFDDVSEDADYESESGDTNAMGDTDAMNIDEAGNVKGIKIEIPGNSYASDFGKAAAREVVESFGPREYRNFLEAFLNEFKKITGGV